MALANKPNLTLMPRRQIDANSPRWITHDPARLFASPTNTHNMAIKSRAKHTTLQRPKPAIKSAYDQPHQARVIAQVVTLLNNHDYFVWRQENNGRIDSAFLVKRLLQLYKALDTCDYNDEQISSHIKRVVNDSYRPVPSSITGVPDVVGFCLRTGRWIAVEVKIGDDVWRDDQKQFAERLKQSGGEFWLCRDFNTFSPAFLKAHYSKAKAA